MSRAVWHSTEISNADAAVGECSFEEDTWCDEVTAPDLELTVEDRCALLADAPTSSELGVDDLSADDFYVDPAPASGGA